MITIEVYNDRCVILNENDPQHKLPYNYSEAVKQELSYSVPSAEWSQKFKQGQWDGKITLYNKRLQTFPTGLSKRVMDLFKDLSVECKFIDKREKPNKDYSITCDFQGKDLRDYQLSAATLAKKYQRGMLSLCTGAGKTMTSCQIFANLQVKPVVFIVPAIELLNQTQKEFEKYLRLDGKPIKVGVAGGGRCNLNMDGVNVITYQTALIAFDKKYVESQKKIVEDSSSGSKSTAQLQKELDEATKSWTLIKNKAYLKFADLKKRMEDAVRISEEEKDLKKKKALSATALVLEKQFNKEFDAFVKNDLSNYKKTLNTWNNRQEILLQKSQVRSLIQSCNALIIDEAHLAVEVTEELGKNAVNAFYKLGLSATPWRTDNQEIRIEGTLGQKIIDVSASDLIERGFLVPPKIFMCKVNESHVANTYPEVYTKNIVHNWERNYRIKQFSEGFKAEGRATLILVERREHGDLLESMIEDSVFVPGGDKGDVDPTAEEKNYRRRMLNAVENNEIILIATQWANVGVDAPRISCLILGGSNQSTVTTYQQAGRVLRCVGKNLEDSKANGKPDAIIVDFACEHKNLKAHSNMRKRVYKNERAWEFYELK
jgi:superfamily II DNA or RNA helicase